MRTVIISMRRHLDIYEEIFSRDGNRVRCQNKNAATVSVIIST